MSRLIDEDVLLARISLNYNNHQNISAGAMKDIINTTPTAYDVEKVVAELEAKENEWWDTYSLSSGFDEYAHGKSVGFEEAIDIVKAGGVE